MLLLLKRESLHSKGANLQADIFGDPTGDRRAGERVGD
jgi:hypothetical protein